MYQSETSKHRELCAPYCGGNGVDLGSGGDPIVPHAINVDLPDRYAEVGTVPIHWRGTAKELPFRDGVLDFVYSSHLLEDFPLGDWWPTLSEWVRVLKSGGHLVILVPDRERWRAALERGQPPNAAHQHEAAAGELSSYAANLGLDVLADGLVHPDKPEEYSLLFVGRKR